MTAGKVYCSSCHDPLDVSADPVGDRRLCPKCGATARTFHEDIAIKVGARVSFEMRHKRRGVGRWLARQFSGWELRKSVGDFVQKHRLIDRENDRYVEKVVTEDGTVIRDIDERLSEHRDRGSAKFKGN